MKFRCEKSVIVEMVNAALHAITAKSTIPALEGILIEANEQLILTGFDLEVGIRCKNYAEILERGTVVINGRLLSDIIRKLPDDIVTISCDEKLYVTISCGVSVFNLVGMSPSDYPELPAVQKERYTTLPQNTLKKIIQGTIFSASENDSRPIITGCLFKITGEELVVVALDSFRLAMRTEHVERGDSTKNLNFVVPAKALREVDRFLSDSDDNINISISRRNICFEFGNTVLTSRLLEGEFLNYQNAIPDSSTKILQAKTADLITALERVSLITNEKLKNFVKCEFSDDKLILTCTTALGQAYDECRVHNLTGSDLTIGFNSRYLLDSLRACRDEEVRLELNTPNSPCIIKPVEGEAFLYLILPVRLKG
jgi:DNA polymerase-3 subunit beta